MVEFVNLTPHDINVVVQDEMTDETTTRVFPRSGTVARVRQPRGESLGALDGIPVINAVYDGVEGIPPEQEGTVYIVGAKVLGEPTAALRTDLIAPATGPGDGVIRDDAGRIIAVTAFVAGPWFINPTLK